MRDLLLRITREMVSARALDEVLQIIVDAALRIVPSAEKCVVHLLDARGTTLEPRVCSKPSAVAAVMSGMPADAGIAGRALRERRLVCVDDTVSAPDFAQLRSGPELRSLMVAPLYVREASLGTLSLNSSLSAAFDATDCRYARLLAAQASVAIHQARLLLNATGERQRSDAIIESISEGLIILDTEGRVARVNLALHHMLELPPAALDVPCDFQKLPGSELRVLLDPSSGEIVGPYEVEMELPSGVKATLRVSPSALRGPRAGRVFVVHDITGERTTSESRALLISQVSHELRTPLQHILSFVSLMTDVDDLPSEERALYLGHIEEEIHHLARLVDDLVELSRVETGRFSVYTERLRLDQLVSEIVSRLTPRAEFRGLSLELDVVEQPAWVIADPLRVEQVLANLVGNACKFTPAGGSIRVSVERTDEHVIVRVADTGHGIPSEALPHVFAPFYQVNAHGRGMGLGLHISQQIVQALGGEIWGESTLGAGSTFSFRLPRVANDTPDERLSE